MGVVLHGSMDQGPLILGDGLRDLAVLEIETDPVFSAWDKHSGISITQSQISDGSTIVNTTNLANLSINTSGNILSANVQGSTSGVNTGDQDLSTLVPYDGASGNVDLGSFFITAGKITINNEPLLATDGATKGYVDNVVEFGIGNPSFTIAHNDTTDKQGGAAGNYWHLNLPTSASVAILTTTTADIVPTGLAVLTSGLNTAQDGTQTAYVTLTWNAISTSTIDHYLIRYKRSNYTYYQTLVSGQNIITIEGLLPNLSYDFGVCSVNKYGTLSAYSTDITVITTADTTAPVTVTGVTVTGGIQCILIEWIHNTDLDLASYNVYRNTTNDSVTAGLIFNITGNRMTDSPLPVSTTYYYWLKAEDTSGNLSTSFSTGVHATTMQVASSDIESISADKVLITGTTYLSSWNSVGSTKIDGAQIDTGTITLSSINFNGGQSGGGIIAHINSSPEGIQIDADNFAVSGSSVFTKKIGGTYTTSATSASRVMIYPDSDTGIEITDDVANDVFKVTIGGVNVGDVIIGDWGNSQGIYYDKSAHTTSFAGTIFASAGTIGGWTISGTALIKDTGTSVTSVGMSPTDYPFYAGSTYANRATAPFSVAPNGDTKIHSLFVDYIAGDCIPMIKYGTHRLVESSIFEFSVGNEANNVVYISKPVRIDTTSGGLIVPKMTTTQRNLLTPINGMIIYNTTTNRFNTYAGSVWYYPSETAGA
jgi:hypothetical protein